MPLSNPAIVNIPAQTPITSPTATTIEVNAATDSAVLVPANANRRGISIYNNSAARLFIDLDAAASLTSFAAILEPGGYYETPYSYVGAISGIWSAANGKAMIREFNAPQ